jgi:hypothetical protein
MIPSPVFEGRPLWAKVKVYEMTTFDFSADAELFPASSRKSSLRRITYKRFAAAAEAIRFAIEELPAESLLGTYLEVEEERFDCRGIRRLYESIEYPLARQPAVSHPYAPHPGDPSPHTQGASGA